jgi:hypothetical protein
MGEIHLVVDGHLVEPRLFVATLNELPGPHPPEPTGMIVRQFQELFQVPEGWEWFVVVWQNRE